METQGNLSGTARRRVRVGRKAGDEVTCFIAGCGKEAHFVPLLNIWGKSDPKHTGKFYVAMPQMPLCAAHADDAIARPGEYFKPDAELTEVIRAALGDEPDFDTMQVQFIGNRDCPVAHAARRGSERVGAYEHYYEPKPADGGNPGQRTRLVK